MRETVERLLGRALRPLRAGDRLLAWKDPRLAGPTGGLCLGSPAFADGGNIPARHAGCGVGENLSPPLVWSGVPAGARTLVLLMQDPDVPLPGPVTHLVASAPASLTGVPEGALTPTPNAPTRAAQKTHPAEGALVRAGVVLGMGSFGRIGYSGPRPVRGHGPHRYVFQLFAVGRVWRCDTVTSPAALAERLRGEVLARARLTGCFERF